MDDSFGSFIDRAHAGRLLAARLTGMDLPQPIVYALPRGGVPVAVEIARALHAPLDLIMVRKIGAPFAPELALAAIVDGERAETVVNEEIRHLTGASDAFLERARKRELEEIERRRSVYLGHRPPVTAAGRTAIIVDDGLATGATAKVALAAVKRRGAARTILAVPVAPRDTMEELRGYADAVICLHPAAQFRGVGAFYDDFHQLTDEETVGLLRLAWAAEHAPEGTQGRAVTRSEVAIPPLHLVGDLAVPVSPRGVVLFAHGSGSSRLSPRNRAVAEDLNAHGFATLLLDLLTEPEAQNRRNVFDIPLLAERLLQAVAWLNGQPTLGDLPLGLFGASTGAAAALTAAAELGARVGAVVSRGGRPDLAGARLRQVTAPTLLIVGGADYHVLELNRQALALLAGEKKLETVPGAGHLFEEPGALEIVTAMAASWFEHHLPSAPGEAAKLSPAAPKPSLLARLRTAIVPLPPPDDPAFGASFDRFGAARIVLLGEASHGTSEFYRARAAITRRLIEHHGFNIVAVEADWPDAAAIDRYVRQRPRQPISASPFTRFPAWMWRNTDMDAFVAQLRALNAARDTAQRVGFYGLDLYNMTASMDAVLRYLDRVDPEAAATARARYGCLAPWSREPAAYGKLALTEGYARCEKPVTRILVDLLQKELAYARHDGEGFFDAEQNARLVVDAELYYRLMYYGSHESWNLRDRHMFATLQRILEEKGAGSKAIVWAHNSHIGDARFTDMGTEHGELNIGQLCRQAFAGKTALIGFGTHTGTVAASSEWDGPMEIKTVRPSRPDSYEFLCHETGAERFLLDFKSGCDEGLRDELAVHRLERYIGVIYRPETERWSHYAHASLAHQYDAFVWFEQTRAVTPMATPVHGGEDETYPFGL
jgi:putative phosphoribosyl transferase